jgi:septal ring factor EnvC (AmiA/AmiB activator)
VSDEPGRVAAPERRSPRRTTGLLLAAALACAAGWALAQHRSAQLQRELTATQSQLSETRTRLVALEAQRSEVHSQLKALAAEASALSGRLAELEALVASAQPGASAAQVLRSESARGE